MLEQAGIQSILKTQLLQEAWRAERVLWPFLAQRDAALTPAEGVPAGPHRGRTPAASVDAGADGQCLQTGTVAFARCDCLATSATDFVDSCVR